MEYLRTESHPDPDPYAPEEGSGGFRRLVIDMAETVILALILFLAINAISARIRVESISMQPTLYAGDFVLVNKLAYRLGVPGRGDVIIFRFPPDPEREPYIKRVIGLPGDHIQIKNGRVYANSQPLSEAYIKAPPNYEGSWVIPEGNLFVLGDNRNNSSDSHSWGMVPLENVIGKAEVVYLPVQHWQMLNQAFATAAEP
jgi:signal peptidase I